MTDTGTPGSGPGRRQPPGRHPAGPDRRHPGDPRLFLVHHRGVHGDRLRARSCRPTTRTWASAPTSWRSPTPLLLLISVLVHELAHALTAKIYGWPTREDRPQPLGRPHPVRELHGLPGPLRPGGAGRAGRELRPGRRGLAAADRRRTSTGVADILANIFVWANLLIGIFNVLPGLPLDGGRLVESAVWKATGSQEKGTVAAGWGGRIIVIALVAWFVALPLLSGERAGHLPSCSSRSWWAASCGWAPSASIQQARLRGRLHLVSAAALAEPAVGPAGIGHRGRRPGRCAGRPAQARRRAVPPGRPARRRGRRRRRSPRFPRPPQPPPRSRPCPTPSAPAPTCRSGPRARN